MRPRDGRQDRGRRRSPIDTVLGGGAGIPGQPDTTPLIDTVLDDTGGNGGEEENPWINPFMEVYEATKTGAMKNLADIQKQMGESFAHRGGYFGGKHAVSQGEVAARTGTYLDQLLAETELGASERQYEDWKRARGEKMGLMNLIPLLLGTESFENIVQMPGQGIGATIGDILGSFAGGAGGALTKGV